MGVKIAITIVVYVLAAVGVSLWLWGDLMKNSETSRNLALSWGTPLAIGLAVWRSMVAQKQVKAMQAGLLSARYQRAVEMLGHDEPRIRRSGFHALRNVAREHYEYYEEDGKVVRVPPETPEEKAAMQAIRDIIEARR